MKKMFSMLTPPAIALMPLRWFACASCYYRSKQCVPTRCPNCGRAELSAEDEYAVQE